jgi:hypothetical protein
LIAEIAKLRGKITNREIIATNLTAEIARLKFCMTQHESSNPFQFQEIFDFGGQVSSSEASKRSFSSAFPQMQRLTTCELTVEMWRFDGQN